MAEFTELQAAAAAWVDQNPALIEAGAPWLDRAGCQAFDWCATDLTTQEFHIPRDPPSVGCTRLLTVVYGTDGDLGARLRELAAVLGSAGWGNGSLPPLFTLDRRPAMWDAFWSSGQGIPLPAALETVPPFQMRPLVPYMRIAWVSRDQPAAKLSLCLGPTEPRRTATPIYRPVEVGQTSFVRLAGQLLGRHEHVIALQINDGWLAGPDHPRRSRPFPSGGRPAPCGN